MAEYTLQSLVGAILDLSQADSSDRGEDGRSTVRPANIAQIAVSVLAERDAAVTARGVRLIDRVDPDVPSVLVCPTAVRQMIRHLLGIAVGSCESGNTVILTSSRDDELLKISVVDDGRPFEAEDIPDDLYNTLDAVVLEAGQGTAAVNGAGGDGRVAVTPMGLTLAVIHALLARQGGMLEVTNRGAVGKQITLAFPLEEIPMEPERAEEVEMAQ